MSLYHQINAVMGKFIDRCLTYDKYMITFYVEDAETALAVMKQLSNHFHGSGAVKEITLYESSNYMIEFFNGCTIKVISKGNMVPGLLSNLIFMDSRIRENYIKEEIKPTIDQYITGEGSAMLNPKPIYLKFYDGGTNEEVN